MHCVQFDIVYTSIACVYVSEYDSKKQYEYCVHIQYILLFS